jgi:hypothetical protein
VNWLTFVLLFVCQLIIIVMWCYCALYFILFALIYSLGILFLEQYEKGLFRPNLVFAWGMFYYLTIIFLYLVFMYICLLRIFYSCWIIFTAW